MIAIPNSDLGGLDSLRNYHLRSGTNTDVADYIDKVLSEQELIERVARSSYSHANGFDKVVLAAGEGGSWKLRFHYWQTAESNTEDTNIHNHRWDFSSQVVSGVIRADYFAVKADRKGRYGEYIYRSPEDTDRYTFEYNGPVSIKLESAITYAKTDCYALDHRMHHRVSILAAPALTVVLQGRVRSQTTSVVRPQAASPVVTSIARMTVDRAALLLAILKANLV